ncbi:MAG: hypothetical protein NVS1B12_07690 [Acidimicrobiales bacterium]
MGAGERIRNACVAGTALLGAALTSVGAVGPASATSSFSFTRLAGADRFDTARLVAQTAFPGGATTALLANGALAHFPDALAGSYLAGNGHGPILLSNLDDIPAPTSQALSSLGVKNVVILGGTAAVDDNVATQLRGAGYQVSRLGGATRYDTAQAVAENPPAAYVGSDAAAKKTAIVASGENFPDALVSGPLGYANAFPVLITPRDSLASQTQKVLTDLGIQSVLIPGGTAAVSQAVEGQIQGMGITTKRFAGADRTDTAAQVATFAVQSLGFSAAKIDLARGDDPADSLSGASVGGVTKTPLQLASNPTTLCSASATYLKNNSPTLTSGYIFGGTVAISQAVQDEATTDARNPNTVAVSASPSTVAANGTATSAVVATVTSGSTPVAGDPVRFTLSGSPGGACGTLSSANATTDASGKASTTYSASTTAGTCTVVATEANGGGSGSTTITQNPANSVTVAANPASVPATGATPSTIAATVKSPSGAAVSGDTVTFTTSGTPAAACGTVSPASGTTDSSGNVNAVYTASSTSGFCTITATESATGSQGQARIDQTSTSSPPATVTITPSSKTLPANGTSTQTFMAQVTNAAGAVSNDPVSFTTSGSPSAACGNLSQPTVSPTDTNGNATVTYTASSTQGTCTITATEANGGAKATATVTQSPPLYNTAITTDKTSVSADGSKVQITVVVTDSTGKGVPSDIVTFRFDPHPTGACGSAPSATTNGFGTATTTYIASTTPGFCTITATEQSGSSAQTTITQTQSPTQPPSPPSANQVNVSAVQNGTLYSVTATVTDSSGKPVAADNVAFAVSPPPTAPSTKCGMVSDTTKTTGATGQASTIYTPSNAGSLTCTVTATEAATGGSGSASVPQ